MNDYQNTNVEYLKIIKLLEQINNDGIRIVDDFWENLIIQSSGAFIGAFFAFVFGLIAIKINQVRERFFKHQKAVVELEYLLNDHLNSIATNQYLIANTIPILKSKYYTYNKLQLFRLPLDLELKLGDLYIINKFFDYKESIVRVNSDFQKTNRAFNNLSSFALTQGTPPADRNFTHLVEQLELIDRFLESLLSDTKVLLAVVRIYFKKLESFKDKGINIYKINGYKKITKKELERELNLMKEEIEQTMKKSKSKVEKIIE